MRIEPQTTRSVFTWVNGWLRSWTTRALESRVAAAARSSALIPSTDPVASVRDRAPSRARQALSARASATAGKTP